MITISDTNDSKIGLYRNLKDISFAHYQHNFFVSEGPISTQKLLKSNIEVISIFALKGFYEQFQDFIIQKYIPFDKQFVAEKDVMNSIVGFRLHQGIMAIGKIPEQTSLLNLKSPIIVLNGIVNSENVGAIVRNAVAFGINSVIFDNSTSSPFLRRAVRVSMGTVFSIKYYRSENLPYDLSHLKNKFRIISSEINKNALPVDKYKFSKESVIIFGSEGKGISEDILNMSNDIIYIPISKSVESINVAASSAIILNQFHNIL